MSDTTMSWLGGGAGLNRAAQTGRGNGGSAGSGSRSDIPVLARPGHHWPLALCTGGYEQGPRA